MANLQVKNIPEDLHERLRRHARENHCTLSASVLAALERELARWEWRKHLAQPAPGPASEYRRRRCSWRNVHAETRRSGDSRLLVANGFCLPWPAPFPARTTAKYRRMP